MYNFSFILAGKVAGMACPGRYSTLEADLAELSENGIAAVVSLTERRLDNRLLKKFSLKYLHLPVEDFTPPSISQIKKFVDFVDSCLAENCAVAVHCGAGIGRTGTMLAGYLVHTGKSAGSAINTVRSKRPGSIETPEQEHIIHQWAELVNKAGKC